MPRILLLTIVLFLSSQALAADWQGYLKEKSIAGQSFGYLANETTGSSVGYTILRLTCFAPHGFRMYLDEQLLQNDQPKRISGAVDNLPDITLPLHQQRNRFFISDKDPAFWDLVAQMIAGTKLRLRYQDTQITYRLVGFTSAYRNYCGWMQNAEDYQQHIHKYR